VSGVHSAPSAIASACLLNFGCGGTYHSDWINLDAVPVSPDVIGHDLTRELPFADERFDAVYGSHVLEHLEPKDAMRLLVDCFRVLKPGGIVRVVVPDLEGMVRLYLSSLEGALTRDAASEERYDWIMLELYDQVVRKTSGGEMAAYLARPLGERQSRFVASRIGDEGAGDTTDPVRRFSGVARLRRRGSAAVSALRRVAASAFTFLLMGSEGSAALNEGMFRRSGEVHQWMYDRFSLGRALERVGFSSVRVRAAGQSDIPEFARYQLELRNGRVRKPDSLFVEGHKPARL